MNQKKHGKKIELQKKLISRQSEHIEDLKAQVESLRIELQKNKDLINSIEPLKNELTKKLYDIDGHEKEYRIYRTAGRGNHCSDVWGPLCFKRGRG